MENGFATYRAGFDKLGKGLADEIEQFGLIMPFAKGDVIVGQGKYIAHVPIVLSGLVKVLTQHADTDKELLLYYIKPQESCIMSFTSAINSQPSKIEAVAEEPTDLLLIPAEKMQYLMMKYQGFNVLFFNQFNIRYLDLLGTINSLVFEGLDTRLLNYLKEKSSATHLQFIDVKHKEIAADLGTAREVISRLLKKLENEGLITQEGKKIKIN